MLLDADGLFRLDVIIAGDTLRTVVRNRSSGELTMDGDTVAGQEGPSFAFGEVAAYEPSRTALAFALGAGEDRVDVDVDISTLRFAERGTVQVTAQAVVRPAPQDPT
jgi:hypothetical protein